MNALAPVLLAPLLALPALPAQDQGSVDVGSRVARCLGSLAGTDAYHLTCSLEGGGNPFMAIRVQGMGGNQAKPKPQVVEMYKEGGLKTWLSNDGDQVLATYQGRFVVRDRDGDWIPCLAPIGSWKNTHTTDLEFIAARLADLGKACDWEVIPGQTLEDRPVRCYEGEISEEDSRLLFRSGALPESGMGGALGQVIMIAGGGGAALKTPETLRRVVVRVFEDPRTKLPLKTVFEVYVKNDPNNPFQVAFPGGQQQDEDEEEDEKGEKKKAKPAMTLTLSLDEAHDGKAKLPAKARKVVGAPEAAAGGKEGTEGGGMDSAGKAAGNEGNEGGGMDSAGRRHK
ncbi:MAG: hypothetical protein R3F30_16145 [Planctomycetota bacterium]